MASQIQTLRPSTKGAQDIFVWQPLQSGIYSTKSRYATAAALRQASQFFPNEEEFKWVKDVWSGRFSPKLKVFLWSTIHRALPTGENLQTRGITSDLSCPRCKETKTIMHLFFHCPFAKKVWEYVPLKQVVHLAAEDTLKTMLVKFKTAHCLPPTGVGSTILPWILWAIWTARNGLVFEGKSSNPKDVATKGVSFAREWNKAQGGESNRLSTLPDPEARTAQPNRSSEQDQTQTITCNTDASWDLNSKRGGLAWIFKKGNGGIARQGTEIQHFVSPPHPLMAEALAIRSGLAMAANLEFSNLKVYSDSLTLIEAIITSTQNKKIYGIVSDIHQISYVFNSISFSYLPRLKNQEADGLAKL